MDKNLKSFLYLSSLLIIILAALFMGFGYIYRYSAMKVYYALLVIFALLTFAAAVFFIILTIMIYYIYQQKSVFRPAAGIIRQGLTIMLPLIGFLAVLLRNDKDQVRNFFIRINNILVESDKLKYNPEQVLVLLPHCLQNSECSHKITNNIGNCTKCGKCCIGQISDITSSAGIDVKVVTGGTAARNIIKKVNPKLILCVACERDLASGISDVRTVPVIGMINERPNGPCYNTTINVDAFKKIVESVLTKDNMAEGVASKDSMAG